MARVTYSDVEGAERSLRLLEHRPVTIGRDAGNDIVLHDPRASRSHAQIVFERGFFVLHDLDSANGTRVNGRRVRVAPLVDAMEIRIGNNVLRFSEEVEELPSRTVAAGLPLAGSERPGPQHAAAPAGPGQPGPAALAARGADPPLTATPPAARDTVEYPPPVDGSPVDSHRSSSFSRDAASESDRAAGASPAKADPPLDNRRLFIDDIDSDPDQLAVRNELDQPLVWFRSPRSGVAFMAKIVATMVVISGLAVTLFLMYERAWIPAATAALITVSFAVMVGAAIPRRSLPVWTDVSRSALLVIARQESGLAFPTMRFLLQDASGALIGIIEKRVFPAAGRRTWHLWDADRQREIARASEDSFLRSLIGRIIGGSIRVLRTNYLISSRNAPVGILNRAKGRPGRLLLEITAPPHVVERRLILGLALVIATTEH